MSDKKYFVLMENGKDTSQVFVSKQPRGAALKAATREVPNPIQLRERGTNRVHNFEGWTEIVDKPANGPAWLPPKIKKANVKKILRHLVCYKGLTFRNFLKFCQVCVPDS